MEKVLQPLNEKAASIIAEHIDLLDAQHVVPELLQLVAHVSAMRVILHRWGGTLCFHQLPVGEHIEQLALLFPLFCFTCEVLKSCHSAELHSTPIAHVLVSCSACVPQI